MPPVSQAYQAYKTAEVGTSSQRDLLIKLFEGADRFIVQAGMAVERKDLEGVHTNCTKAKRIFIELLSTLNFEQGGEIAGQLRDLYLFIVAEITEANLRKDREKLEKIRPVIATLLDAWRNVPDEHANTSSLPSQQGDVQSFNVRT